MSQSFSTPVRTLVKYGYSEDATWRECLFREPLLVHAIYTEALDAPEFFPAGAMYSNSRDGQIRQMTAFRQNMNEVNSFAESSVRGLVIKSLVQHNWQINVLACSALVRKSFQSAVGDKEGVVYFRSFIENYLLEGTYYSEGRNCLEPHGVLIPKSANESEILQLVNKFAVGIARAIAESYAVKLLATKGCSRVEA